VPQGERNLRLDCERRVTAGKDELQALGRKRGGVHRHLRPIAGDEQAKLGRERPVAADAVRRVVASRRHQPGARLLGTPSRGHRSAAMANASCADQGGQDAAPFLAEDLFERRYQYTSEGRISMAPP
jgi:hypothetical protein